MRTNRHTISEQQQTPHEIVSNVIEMRRDGVYSAPEIEVVRKEEVVDLSKTPRNV